MTFLGYTLSGLLMLAFQNFIEILLYVKVYNTFFEKREWAKTKWKFILLLASYLVLEFSVNMIGKAAVNLLGTITLTLLVLLIGYQANFSKGVAYTIMLAIIFGVSEVFLALVIIPSFVASVDYSNLSNPYYSFSGILVKALIVFLLCTFTSKEKVKLGWKYLVIELLVPITSIFVFLTVCSIAEGIELTPSQNVKYIIAGVALLIGNLVAILNFETYAAHLKSEQELAEEKFRIDVENDVISIAAKTMSRRLEDAEQIMEKDRRMRHDRRHFEGTILALLEEGNSEKAIELLKTRMEQEQSSVRRYCDNTTINATISYYAEQANNLEIPCTIETDIPDQVSVDELGLAIAIGNLFENAINACKELPKEQRFIHIKAVHKKQLLIEIENSCEGIVELNSDGVPYSIIKGHGIGTKSVLAFAEHSNTEVTYKANDGTFRVRLMV